MLQESSHGWTHSDSTNAIKLGYLVKENSYMTGRHDVSLVDVCHKSSFLVTECLGWVSTRTVRGRLDAESGCFKEKCK